MNDDRRVHAKDRYVEVVRYERAGRWYIEPFDRKQARHHVSVEQAARRASVCRHFGGRTYLGLPGGTAFDRAVKRFDADGG